MSMNGCTIQNARINLIADVLGGDLAPLPGADGAVIICGQNKQGGTRNQNWRFLPVNAGQNLFVIQCLLTGGYASVDFPHSGQEIKTRLISMPWKVTVADNWTRNFIIKLPNTNLVWSVPGTSGPHTKITISPAQENATNQQWMFNTAL